MDEEKKIWLVVKRWPGGAWNYESAYLDEDSARYAASKVVSDQWMVSLETVPLGISLSPITDMVGNDLPDGAWNAETIEAVRKATREVLEGSRK